ncbi:rhodanese-like domain-containing protein [Gilvimarinus agarilyticus]|uniref:rhodanese-like domain-containing protein n=1 Tax=unclassified Gilvimarinus TaxID=2642066 RepID=UPI001C080264|nr:MULTISPECIES: rhodanese-like domain-containing protein [unclassified Gilvimarinus]MBU2887053.1 rhodanese-like domain-containing protein [Gilvimarinus agarilyticus]MDO6571713.1 rhodanese-like domain-containing protein [Gilvimarinus sp. 2_MG-2023]MDO6745785.1 rhodanese-like domain-containing protein [Gilvimarinus sp. 1_MG-2023]
MKWLGLIASLAVLLWVQSSFAHGEGRVVIDVRSAEEYAAGHVAQAVNIPHDEIAEGVIDINAEKSTEIILYCRSGRRAELAKEVLHELGYTHVVNAQDAVGAEAMIAEHDHNAE